MDVVDVLLGARDKIAEGFVKHVLAVDVKGMSCESSDEVAAAWCAYGALYAMTNGGLDRSFGESVPYLMRVSPTPDIVAYNNAPETTQEDMVELFDQAAKLAKDEGA